jgi:hypothetical protein
MYTHTYEGWYWGLNSGPSSCYPGISICVTPLALFALLIFQIGSHFLPTPPGVSYLPLPCQWNNKHTLHIPSLLVEMDSCFLPISSSQVAGVYKRELWCQAHVTQDFNKVRSGLQMEETA